MTSSGRLFTLKLIALLAAVLVWGALGVRWICRRSRGSSVATQLIATVCVVYWILAWGFQILGLSNGFRPAVVVPLFLAIPALVVWAWRSEIRQDLQGLGSEIRAELALLGSSLRKHPLTATALAGVGLHLIFRALRVLATPSFGADDFTYHLFRAGRWVQLAGIHLEPAPDAWTYYEFFPWGGDLLWAWTLIWGLGDSLVSFVALGIWVACLVAAYGVARCLGSDSLTSLIVALALCALPSQISLLNTAYVDNLVLFLFLAATLFLLQLWQLRPTSAAQPEGASDYWWFLFGAVSGLGLLVKLSFLPMAAVAFLVTMAFGIRQRHLKAVASFVLGTTVAVPNLMFNFVHRGSPFYPFELLELLPYNEQLSDVLGKYGSDNIWQDLPSVLKGLVVNTSAPDPFLNVGWTGLLLLVLGLLGVVRLLENKGAWVYLTWSLAGALLTIAHLVNPANGSMLTWWGNVLGRFLVPSMAVYLLLACLAGGRVVRVVLLPVMVAEYFLYTSWRWPHPVLGVTLILFVVLVVFVAAGRMLWRRAPRPVAIGAVVGMLTLFLTLAVRLHDFNRYESYRLFSEVQLDDFHRAPPMGSWAFWALLEAEGPATIAATGGWDGFTGQNWFRYPLMGSRLQNHVIYVPITVDGSLVSYAEPEAMSQAAERSVWLERLATAGVDWVVAQGPQTTEHAWIESLPEIFCVELTNGEGSWILARINRKELGDYVSEPS